jgi:hypothetical protein
VRREISAICAGAITAPALHSLAATECNAMLPSFEIQCPYCGESIEILVDDSAGGQRYIEDCQVCCRPITITVSVDEDGTLRVDAAGEDDA